MIKSKGVRMMGWDRIGQYVRSGVTALTLCVAGILGVQHAHATAPSAGLSKLQVPYHVVGIELVIWYPTDGPSRAIDAFSVQFDGAPDGPLPTGEHALILLSHGTGGMNLGHYPIAIALARAGFIVVSMTHPGDNFRDRSLIADTRYFHERPRQISLVLDAILADAKWASLIDPTRIGAIGHSAGGYAVAALVGAEPDRSRLALHCQQVSDDPACAYGDPTKGLLSTAGERFELPASVQASGTVKDDRIRSAVLLAPFGAVIKPDSLSKTQVPVKLVGAAEDEILARKYHYEWIKAQLEKSPVSAQHAVSLAAGTSHFSFLAPFSPSFVEATRAKLGDIVVPKNGFDRRAFQEHLAREIVLWMQSTLK